MATNGYIPLSRKFFEHELWLEPRVFSRAEAFIDLLRRARFEASPATILIGLQSITIGRGEAAVSARSLAKDWGWSKDRAIRFLDFLSSQGEIVRRNLCVRKTRSKNATGCATPSMVVTLCNYDVYHSATSETDTEVATPTRHQRDAGAPPNKKENNIPVSSCEDTGMLCENNITYLVRDKNAPAREKNLDPRKTLRKDDAGIPGWRESFDVYLDELRKAYKTLLSDEAWISTQRRYYPTLDIAMTIEKACVNFWATEAGWEHKKRQRTKSINWRQTLTNSLAQPQNKVYHDERTHKKNGGDGVSDDFKRRIYATLLGTGGPA